jgi:hypothetical protein
VEQTFGNIGPRVHGIESQLFTGAVCAQSDKTAAHEAIHNYGCAEPWEGRLCCEGGLFYLFCEAMCGGEGVDPLLTYFTDEAWCDLHGYVNVQTNW